MEFIGGVGADEDGGGSSIWIANNKEISNGRPSELIFRNCRWEDNQGPRKGGAFHYGNSQTLIGTELTFEDCKFINNVIKNYWIDQGVDMDPQIWIQNQMVGDTYSHEINVIFENCLFIGVI